GKSEVGSRKSEPSGPLEPQELETQTQKPRGPEPPSPEPSTVHRPPQAPPAPEPQSPTGPQPLPQKKSLKKGGAQDTPRLMALEAMLAEVKAEEAELLTQEVQEVTQERVEEAWNLYLESQDQESVKVIMRNSELKLEGQNVLVTVTSALAENTIRQEGNLMEYMRDVLTAPELTMTIEIDKSKAVEPPKRKRMMSSKDKYLAMREVNPNITELQKRFDLRPDE
ncbi:MAG: hypothetical protein KDD19_29085, partial [Phaeodactylibacter sp.]|nr:hypothetical protein [Phaeodactylibacter sp.]